MMSTGAKDAAIARELGLSLRTVRAEISALIAGLGAKSRFQAGCLLVRRFGNTGECGAAQHGGQQGAYSKSCRVRWNTGGTGVSW